MQEAVENANWYQDQTIRRVCKGAVESAGRRSGFSTQARKGAVYQ